MSLFQEPPPRTVAAVVPAPAESNALGLAGFICSMLGLFVTGGLLCPIGVILSLVALGRRPRGFAIAGLVIGLVGSCGIGILAVVFGAAILAALGLAVVAVALTEPEKVEITSDMVNMVIAIKEYEETQRYLPADLDALDLQRTMLTDPWGQPYAYHLIDTDPGFDIESAGADGVFGTADDVRLSALGQAWDASGFNVSVSESGDGGRVRITVGDRTITAGGDGDGGHITVDLGDRVIEIVGDDAGATVDVEATGTTRPDAPQTPEAPEAPEAPDKDDG